jgi:hypothetical protein
MPPLDAGILETFAALGADEDRRLACPQHDPGRLLRFNQREQRVDGRHA